MITFLALALFLPTRNAEQRKWCFCLVKGMLIVRKNGGKYLEYISTLGNATVQLLGVVGQQSIQI